MDPIEELIRLLARLPGIGERTAARLAFYILGSETEYAEALGASVGAIHRRVKRCSECGNYGANEVCSICADPRRDASVLCVVARVQDLLAIERSGAMRGRYFVLGRLLSPLEGVSAEDLPIDAIKTRVKNEREPVKEILVATPPSVDGEATALLLARELVPLGVRVTRIASGIPLGGDLEYADQVTLGRAIEGRKNM